MSHTQAVGSRAQVMNGTAHHTSGGLTKKDLKYSGGEIVSKDKSKSEKKNPWIEAVKKAKKSLGIPKTEFALVTKGSELYKRAKQIYSK
jgi:hypothetical protein